jgi:hypothetical protein
MKKIALSLMLITLFSGVYAQEQDTLKSRDGDWGVVLNLTGLINNISIGNLTDVNNNNTILVKHHLTNDKVLRFGLGLKTISNNWSSEDSISLSSGNRALQQIDSTEKRFDFSIAVGMEKHLGNTKRLDPYLAGEMVIGRIGSTKIDAGTDITDVTGTQKIQRIIQQDGGFTFGLNAIAGFNYFFSERISIGAEVNMGYLYSSVGGDQSESLVDTPVSGSQVTSFTSSKSKSSTKGFGVSSTAGLMLSFFF